MLKVMQNLFKSVKLYLFEQYSAGAYISLSNAMLKL